MVDPIEVLIDVKTSLPDPKYTAKINGRNYKNRHQMTVKKLPSEKPGYTIYSYKCTKSCHFNLPNVTDVASVKSRNWVQPGTYKKEKIVDGWKVRVVSRPTSPHSVNADAIRPGGYNKSLAKAHPHFYIKMHWVRGRFISHSHSNANIKNGKLVVLDPIHGFARWNFYGFKKFLSAEIVDTRENKVKKLLGKVSTKIQTIKKSAKTLKEKNERLFETYEMLKSYLKKINYPGL